MKPESRPAIYVAGPYTIPDPIENTRAAIFAGDAVWDAGGCPIIPHLTMLWHLVSPQDYEHWLERDLSLLALCDGLLRLPGESRGADAEVAWAREHEILVRAAQPDDVAAAAAHLVELTRMSQW